MKKYARNRCKEVMPAGNTVGSLKEETRRGQNKFMRHYYLILILLLLFASNSESQVITTIAGVGSGSSSGDGGPATAAHTPLTFSGAFDSSGNYYFSENAGAPRIRKIDRTGIITTVAGNGTYGYSGDGFSATAAAIKNSFFTVDKAGNIFIADVNNNRLRKVDVTTGIITTIAGDGTPTSTGDGGPASAAKLSPLDVCVDSIGNLFIGENGGSIRKINTIGVISTLIPGLGFEGMDFDQKGYLYAGINTRIIKINVITGHIDTIAGTGIATYSGDEIPATTANLKVFDLALDRLGNIYVAEIGGNRVRHIDTFGIIHTLAGDGTGAFSGDGGPSTAARVWLPEGVATDVCGNIYVADESNHRIREITAPITIITVPSISLSGIITAPAGSSVTVNATVAHAGSSYIIHWLNKGVEFTTTTVPSVTYTKGTGTDTITARVVSTATYGCYDSTTSSQHIIKIPVVGVTTLPAATHLSMYPNPVGNVLHIEGLQGSAMYRLSDMTGRVISTGNVDNVSNAVNVGDVAKGVYMLEVADIDRGKTIFKVIKQ